METLPRNRRNRNNNELSDKPSANGISDLFRWDETQSTKEVSSFLELKTRQTEPLSIEKLNTIFQKHNGKEYCISDEIGSGGFGSVYTLVDDDNSGLCVKVIDLFFESIRDKDIPKNVTNKALMSYSQFITRLKFADREYSINTKLHENRAENCIEFIPEISFVDHSVRPYLTFIVMKRMDGNIRNRPEQLEADVTNRSLALTAMTDILRALDTINVLDITSRDVNPGNIMYKYESESKVHFYLGDFGIGTINGKNFTVTDTYSVYRDHNTPASERDIRSDIYSLALVAAYIDQGFPKDENGNPKNMHSYLDQKRKNPEENDRFTKILCKATESKIDLRYSSPDEIRTDILLCMTDVKNKENSLVSLEVLKDFLNEQHEKETEKLREEYQAQLAESDDLISDLNNRNSEQLETINTLKDQLASAGKSIVTLKDQLSKKEQTISGLNSDNANLVRKNRDLEDENAKYAEIAEELPDKLWLSAKTVWIAVGIIFGSGILLDLILPFDHFTMIHYIITVIASCIYIWLLYSKRIETAQSIKNGQRFGYSTMRGETITLFELRLIRLLTILSVLFTLPAVNIIRWFSEIRDKSAVIRTAYFESILKTSFSTSSLCVYLSLCLVIGITLYSTYYFAYVKKRMLRMKDVVISLFAFTALIICFEAGMYFFAGYNTLGFRIVTNEPVIYWHDPSISISRTSKLSNAASAIRLYNNGVVNVSYDAENKELLFTDSYIDKPLYFNGNIKLKISGSCTFENTTDQNAPNISVYNGWLSIDRNPNSKLVLENTNGTNIHTDRYLWIAERDDFEVSASCNSDNECIYAGYGTTTHTNIISVSNSGNGSVIRHGYKNSNLKHAKNVTIIKSATGASETIPINEISNAGEYISGVKYDSENKTLILNNAKITAPISFDGFVILSINGNCSFTNPDNYPNALLNSEGSVDLYFGESSKLEMTNHSGADIIAKEYINYLGKSVDVKSNYVCNTPDACFYAGFSTNINHNVADIINENEEGDLFHLDYKSAREE